MFMDSEDRNADLGGHDPFSSSGIMKVDSARQKEKIVKTARDKAKRDEEERLRDMGGENPHEGIMKVDSARQKEKILKTARQKVVEGEEMRRLDLEKVRALKRAAKGGSPRSESSSVHTDVVNIHWWESPASFLTPSMPSSPGRL